MVNHQIGRREEVAAQSDRLILHPGHQELSYGLVDTPGAFPQDVDSRRQELAVGDPDLEHAAEEERHVSGKEGRVAIACGSAQGVGHPKGGHLGSVLEGFDDGTGGFQEQLAVGHDARLDGRVSRQDADIGPVGKVEKQVGDGHFHARPAARLLAVVERLGEVGPHHFLLVVPA